MKTSDFLAFLAGVKVSGARCAQFGLKVRSTGCFRNRVFSQITDAQGNYDAFAGLMTLSDRIAFATSPSRRRSDDLDRFAYSAAHDECESRRKPLDLPDEQSLDRSR